jgi:microcompartment protein CcmL/EutN
MNQQDIEAQDNLRAIAKSLVENLDNVISTANYDCLRYARRVLDAEKENEYLKASLLTLREKLDAKEVLSTEEITAKMKEVEIVSSLQSQIDGLAGFITANVPGEPAQSEGACDTAVRIIKNLQEQVQRLYFPNGSEDIKSIQNRSDRIKELQTENDDLRMRLATADADKENPVENLEAEIKLIRLANIKPL